MHKLSEDSLRSRSIDELIGMVRHHNRLYWDLNAPEIHDVDYDRLVRRLAELAPDHPVLDEMGPSGDLRFGAEVQHRTPMLSLDKCYDEATLQNWADKFEGQVVVTPKLDGLAASLIYDAQGVLQLAATRGKGNLGEDITRNVRQIGDVPTRLRNVSHELEVRGEIFMRLSVFERFKAAYANPRNLTAGAVRNKDAAKSAGYQLSFFAYDVLGTDLQTETAKLDLLESLGFCHFERHLIDKAGLQRAYERLAALRPQLDYEIDGVVYKVDDVAEQERLGSTSHHPRCAIAYKFQGETGSTQLLDVEWSVSRSGAVTPVALLEPIVLSGASISRATLHNAGFIAKLGVSRGAEVLLTRAGGVIPKVEAVLEPGDGSIALPESCPSCGRPTQLEGDFLRCTLPLECKEAVMGTLAHYARTAGIQGFGRRKLEDGYKQGTLREPVDLYRINLDDLLALERTGLKTAQNLVAERERARRLPLSRFLAALGLGDLGRSASRQLATRFGSLAALRAAGVEDIAAIDGFGATTGETIVSELQRTGRWIDELLEEVELVEEEPQGPVDEEAPLAGRSFLFTGKLDLCTRSEAQKRVKKFGGAVASGVSAQLSYLVLGASKGKPSSKEKKARALIAAGASLKLLSEEEFLAMLTELETTPAEG